MDVLEFVASIISSLAWPTAAVALAVLFRKPLSLCLERVRSAKGAGFVVELLDNQLKQLEAKADEADLPPAPRQAAIADNRTPSVRIFEAWRDLESQLNEVFERVVGHGPESYSELREFLNRMASEGKIPSQSISIFNNLRSIRNQAVHPRSDSPDVSEAQAEEFANLTARLMGPLIQLR